MYFILQKSQNEKIDDNKTTQIIYTNNLNSYILCKNLIDDYIKNGLFESNIIEWSRQFCRSDKIFLDIGAHTGTYSISLYKNCKHVYSFEPQKMTYYALCGSVALSNCDNITCYNFGLGSDTQTGENILNIPSIDGGGSSICQLSNIIRQEKVDIKTLDSLNCLDISFIKIDVEGNELSTLKGSINTLKRNNLPHILFECNDCNNNKELFNFLTDIGYKCNNIGVWNMFLAFK